MCFRLCVRGCVEEQDKGDAIDEDDEFQVLEGHKRLREKGSPPGVTRTHRRKLNVSYGPSAIGSPECAEVAVGGVSCILSRY